MIRWIFGMRYTVLRSINRHNRKIWIRNAFFELPFGLNDTWPICALSYAQQIKTNELCVR